LRSFQRADAAGQGDEGVGLFEHQPFALVHVGGDDHLGGAVKLDLPRLEKAGDDAGDTPAIVGHRAGHGAHQADRPAAIHQADAGLCHAPAKLARRRFVKRIAAHAGAAEYANVSNRCHRANGPWIGSAFKGGGDHGRSALLLGLQDGAAYIGGVQRFDEPTA